MFKKAILAATLAATASMASAVTTVTETPNTYAPELNGLLVIESMVNSINADETLLSNAATTLENNVDNILVDITTTGTTLQSVASIDTFSLDGTVEADISAAGQGASSTETKRESGVIAQLLIFGDTYFFGEDGKTVRQNGSSFGVSVDTNPSAKPTNDSAGIDPATDGKIERAYKLAVKYASTANWYGVNASPENVDQAVTEIQKEIDALNHTLAKVAELQAQANTYYDAIDAIVAAYPSK